MDSTSLRIACTALLTIVLCISIVSCSTQPRNAPQRFGTNIRTTTNTGGKVPIVGKVVFQDNQSVPDSLECTVSFRNSRTNQKIIIPVKNGVFRIENYIDGKYKFEAVSKNGSMRGSAIVTIVNGRPKGSSGTDEIFRVILGKENLREKPHPPNFYEGKTDPMLGKIREKLE